MTFLFYIILATVKHVPLTQNEDQISKYSQVLGFSDVSNNENQINKSKLYTLEEDLIRIAIHK